MSRREPTMWMINVCRKMLSMTPVVALATGVGFTQSAEPSGDPALPSSWFESAVPQIEASEIGDIPFWDFTPDVMRQDAIGAIYVPGSPIVLPRTCDIVGCSGVARSTHEWPLYRQTPGGSMELIGKFTENCWFNTFYGFTDVRVKGVDPINGYLYLMVDYVRSSDCQAQPTTDFFMRLSGIPSLLDIILSYQPPSTLTFNVPVHPEALPSAESFSVYSGNVSTVSDLSEASPLECTVPPDRPPVPGEHLTVADTLPDPGLGEARYYVAAVNYQGQRRAGRQSVNGVLQGRNAAALPECQ